MEITAKIDRLVQKGNIKAIASVSLDGMFVVKGLKVMDGRKGLFVSMPQESYPGQGGQTKYSNLFFALTNSARMELQEVVLQAYQQKMDPNYVPRQSYGRGNDQQTGHYQRDQYPYQFQQSYPEPGYRNQNWASDYDDILPMDLR